MTRPFSNQYYISSAIQTRMIALVALRSAAKLYMRLAPSCGRVCQPKTAPIFHACCLLFKCRMYLVLSASACSNAIRYDVECWKDEFKNQVYLLSLWRNLQYRPFCRPFLSRPYTAS